MLLPPPYSYRRRHWLRSLTGCLVTTASLHLLLLLFRHLAARFSHSELTAIVEYDTQLQSPVLPTLMGLTAFFLAGIFLSYSRLLSTGSKYNSWLRLTPWQPGLPSVFGPAYIDRHHASSHLFAAALLASVPLTHSINPSWSLFAIFIGLLLMECLVTTGFHADGRGFVKAMIIIALIPLLILFYSPWLLLALLIAAAVIFNFALYSRRHAVTAPPTPVKPINPVYLTRFPEILPHPFQHPFDLHPAHFYIPIILLVGWYTFALTSRLSASSIEQHDAASSILWLVVFFASMIRIAHLAGTNPLPWHLRLRIGRLSVPKYDIFYLGQFLTLLLGPLAYHLMHSTGFYPPLNFALTLMIILACATLTPPTYRNWHFTGGWSVDTRRKRRIPLQTTPAILSK